DKFMNKLPGVVNRRAPKSGKKFNVPIKIVSVKFSHTNRSWAVGTTEGIFIYSLDTSLTFSSLQLDINITTKTAEEAFAQGAYYKALIYSVSLNNNDLIGKCIDSTPHTQIALICNKLPFNVVGPVLNFLCKKVETDKHIQLYLLWIFTILKFNGENLRLMKSK